MSESRKTSTLAPILLVEDEEIHVELMERAARKCGLERPMVVANDGDEALRLLIGDRENAPTLRPGLVLLDLKLPGTDGLEVLAAIKRDPRLMLTPVLIFSCSDAPEDVRAAYRAGANAYLVKPMSFKDSCQMLDRLLAFWLSENTPPPARP